MTSPNLAAPFGVPTLGKIVDSEDIFSSPVDNDQHFYHEFKVDCSNKAIKKPTNFLLSKLNSSFPYDTAGLVNLVGNEDNINIFTTDEELLCKIKKQLHILQDEMNRPKQTRLVLKTTSDGTLSKNKIESYLSKYGNVARVTMFSNYKDNAAYGSKAKVVMFIEPDSISNIPCGFRYVCAEKTRLLKVQVAANQSKGSRDQPLSAGGKNMGPNALKLHNYAAKGDRKTNPTHNSDPQTQSENSQIPNGNPKIINTNDIKTPLIINPPNTPLKLTNAHNKNDINNPQHKHTDSRNERNEWNEPNAPPMWEGSEQTAETVVANDLPDTDQKHSTPIATTPVSSVTSSTSSSVAGASTNTMATPLTTSSPKRHADTVISPDEQREKKQRKGVN